MRRATLQGVLVLLGPMIFSLAAALTAASATYAAAGSAPDSGNDAPELISLLPLRIVETESGSLITISGGSILKAYSSRRIGEWFEVRIEKADCSRVQPKFEGTGFDRGHVIQSGDAVVFLFHLIPGVNPRLSAGTNSLDVEISSKRMNETKPVITKGAPPAPPLRLKPLVTSQPLSLNLPTEISLALPTRVSIDEAPPPPKIAAANPALPRLSHVKVDLPTQPLAPSLPNEGIFKWTPISVSIDEEAPPPPQSSASAKNVEAASVTEASGPPTLNASIAEFAPSTPKAGDASGTSVNNTSASDDAEKATDSAAPVTAPISFPSGIIPSKQGRPHEKRLTLNGVFTFGYSRTGGEVTATGDQNVGSSQRDRANDLGLGLDLNLGTYLLDPRFLKFSLGTSFFWDKGAYDQFGTRQTNKAVNFYADFLPTSPHPLRFHYLKQNSNFLERQILSATAGRDSFGFDWALRKPKLPSVTISFDNTDYDSRFLASSAFKSKARTFNATVSDSYLGWDINGGFSNQAAKEGITNLKTGLNEVRLDARRQIGKRSNLFLGSYAERLNFSSVATQIRQQFSFFDFHADLTSRLTDKLTARASYQFYYNANRDNSSPALTNSTSATEAEPEKVDSPSATEAVPQNASTSFLRSRTTFNAFTGELAYRLLPEITVSGMTNERLNSSPDNLFETATNYTDFSGTVSWNRRLKSVETRASYTQGLSSVGSNLGNRHRVEFHTYSAGLSFGNPKRALVTADFNSSARPDNFQLGGSFSLSALDVGVETQAVRGIHLRAMIGANRLDYLTANGRERFDHTTFSVSVDKRPLTFAFSRNAKTGVRDLFLVPIDLNHGQLFVVLPVNSLIRDPLLNTSGKSTMALLRVNPKSNLDIEVRYLKDNLFFVRTNDVFVKQFDVLVTYRIGKITLTGGAIFYRQVIEGLFSRDRHSYFIRLSRPFNIF